MRRSESDAIERLAWVALALKRARTAADLRPCATLTLWLGVPGTASNLVRVGGRVRVRGEGEGETFLRLGLAVLGLCWGWTCLRSNQLSQSSPCVCSRAMSLRSVPRCAPLTLAASWLSSSSSLYEGTG